MRSTRCGPSQSKIVHGRSRHSQSQGGIERCNRTVEDKLGSWMTDNKSTKWSVGRLFVRWQINTQFSSAVGSSPYKLLIGGAPRLGLSSLPLDRKLLDSLHTEAQAIASLSTLHTLAPFSHLMFGCCS